MFKRNCYSPRLVSNFQQVFFQLVMAGPDGGIRNRGNLLNGIQKSEVTCFSPFDFAAKSGHWIHRVGGSNLQIYWHLSHHLLCPEQEWLSTMKCNWIPDLLRKLQGPEKADGLRNVIPCCQTVSILKIISIFCRLLNGLARSSAENKNLPILNKLRSLKIVLALKCFGLERKYLTITLCRPKKKNCVAPTQCEHHSTRYQKNHE